MKSFRNILRTTAVALAFAVLAGCAVLTGDTRRSTYVDHKPGLSPAVRQAILKGTVIPGMTMDDVRASIGPPYVAESVATTEGVSETWTYNFPKTIPVIKFRDGVVVETANLP